MKACAAPGVASLAFPGVLAPRAPASSAPLTRNDIASASAAVSASPHCGCHSGIPRARAAVAAARGLRFLRSACTRLSPPRVPTFTASVAAGAIAGAAAAALTTTLTFSPATATAAAAGPAHPQAPGGRGRGRGRGGGVLVPSASSAETSSAAVVETADPPFAMAFGSEVPSLESLRELAGPPVVPDRLAHAKERRFGAEGQEPELLLYRDNSSWCPYCERVWIQLEEKQVPYRVEKINMRCYGPKPAWFMQMVPSGLLPVIEFKGRIVTESLDIMLLIEEAYPNHKPLLPSDAEGRRRVQQLLRLERQLMGAWLQYGKAPARGKGAGAWFGGGGGGAQETFESVMVQVDEAIAQLGGPYFLGAEFSLVDAVYAPFIERLAASIPFWKGSEVRGNPKWPHINSWIDAMDTRPVYQAIKSDDFTITHTLVPQIGPVVHYPEGEKQRALIEGKDGGWDLPLKPENTAWGYDSGDGKGGVKEEAAQALISNHEAIVGFAMRSLGKKPSEAPNEAEHVSAGFRIVAHALLKGVENAPPLPAGIDAKTVAVAAAYLRDRIGVPRDLRYPAARQLRAHLQWLVRSLGSDL